jgi:hypothetical protein
MGLTIHYRLKAKGSASSASKLVTSLHHAAHDLPFKEVGSIMDLSGSECMFDRREKDDPLRWLLCQAQGSVEVKGVHRMPDGKWDDSYVRVNPAQVIAFTAWPGEGCEDSNIGLCQYPSEIFSSQHGTLKTKLSGWSWRSFCKTQYASNLECGGIANFLRCHLAVIALMDKAKSLGCLEHVSDEGQFWENRNVEALVKSVGSWNQMIAAFGGKLKDVVGEGVEMPIAEYPNFEQLEAAGQSKLPPDIEQLAQLIKQVSQKS